MNQNKNNMRFINRDTFTQFLQLPAIGRAKLEANPFHSKVLVLLITPQILKPSTGSNMDLSLWKTQDSFGGKFELVSCQDNRCSSNYSTIAAPSLMSHFFYKSLLLCFSSKSYQSFVSWPPTDLPLLSCCNIKKDKIFKIKTGEWVTALHLPVN